MSAYIDLQKIPAQQFTITLSGYRFDITIRGGIGTMLYDISRDDAILVVGARLLPNQLLIPYLYLEADAGNFLMTTNGDEYPNYILFGDSQFLWYSTPAEMVAYRG